MKKLLSILFLLLLLPVYGQGIYKAAEVKVGFFSSAPIEDIAAHTDDGLSLWNTRTDEITFRIRIRGFEFEKSRMQEHFNENFMESHSYPTANFHGEFLGEVNPSRDGNYSGTVKGQLEIHGVIKIREIPVEVAVRNGQMHLKVEFEVAVADHNIKIPKILWNNIAEVVQVNVEAEYSKLNP